MHILLGAILIKAMLEKMIAKSFISTSIFKPITRQARTIKVLKNDINACKGQFFYNS